MKVVYFSSATENTKRFVEKLGLESHRIPLYPKQTPLEMNENFVLITPTYGGGTTKGAVPKQVIKFLNDEKNRSLCIGVISSGNTNFGEAYLLAGKIISSKLQVPILYGFELLGTSDDVEKVKTGLSQKWDELMSIHNRKSGNHE